MKMMLVPPPEQIVNPPKFEFDTDAISNKLLARK